jgi:hypothetical protein
MIFEIRDLIRKQKILSSKKKIDRVCKFLDRNDIDTFQHSLKSGAVRGNTLGREKGKQIVFRSAEGQ